MYFNNNIIVRSVFLSNKYLRKQHLEKDLKSKWFEWFEWFEMKSKNHYIFEVSTRKVCK